MTSKPTATPTTTVSLVTTVLNEREGCDVFLQSLIHQTRRPDEVVVVDGGSTDGTLDVIRAHSQRDPSIRLIEAPGCNIGQGRNLGVKNATGRIIVSTDTGCRLEPQWCQKVVQPFIDDPEVEFVGGTYKIESHSSLEEIIGAVTMRGVLDPIDPETFNPSCRSMAYTKNLWQRSGGFPEWTPVDDNLFNLRIRQMNVRRAHAADAVVHWRPRPTLKSLYKQFRVYASTTGHTQLDAGATRYNLRNIAITVCLLAAGFLHPAFWIAGAASFLYFFVYNYHGKCRRVAKRCKLTNAYELAMLVHWTVVAGDAVGYLHATWQRLRRNGWYAKMLQQYLNPESTGQQLATQ